VVISGGDERTVGKANASWSLSSFVHARHMFQLVSEEVEVEVEDVSSSSEVKLCAQGAPQARSNAL
jgi:hypothetical protein